MGPLRLEERGGLDDLDVGPEVARVVAESRYQRPPGQGSIFMGKGVPSGMTLAGSRSVRG